MAENKAFIEAQADKFVKEIIRIYDSNKEDERKKFKDIMGRYDDALTKRVNELAPATIYEIMKPGAVGPNVDKSIQYKPYVYAPQSRPATMPAGGFHHEEPHSMMGTGRGFYPQQPRINEQTLQRPVQLPSHPPTKYNEPNLDYIALNSDPFHHPQLHGYDHQAMPHGHHPGMSMRQPRQGAPGFNYPMYMREPEKPQTHDDIIKKQIEVLGGLESSLDYLEGSLRDNELRHYSYNMALNPGMKTRDLTPTGRGGMKLESSSPLRNNYQVDHSLDTSGYQHYPQPGYGYQQQQHRASHYYPSR